MINLVANFKGTQVEINPDNYYFPQSVSNYPGSSVAYAIGAPIITAATAAIIYGMGSGINAVTNYCLDMEYSAVRHAAIVTASGLMTAYALDNQVF
ncbi:MAG: hypothetical protein EOP33_01145 [Rickettsiaceae bacterium]|nr:MAG: hypothetical protein EOP33_01145 [Rickettsiaceae bacterium]